MLTKGSVTILLTKSLMNSPAQKGALHCYAHKGIICDLAHRGIFILVLTNGFFTVFACATLFSSKADHSLHQKLLGPRQNHYVGAILSSVEDRKDDVYTVCVARCALKNGKLYKRDTNHQRPFLLTKHQYSDSQYIISVL